MRASFVSLLAVPVIVLPPASEQLIGTQGSAVGRNFVQLGLGEIAARLIAFGATVYLARALGAGVYGVVALAGAVLLYATYVADAGIDTLGVPAVARAEGGLRALVSSLLLARLAVAAVLAVVVAVAGLALLPQPEGAVIAAYAMTLPVRALTARWAHLGQGRAGTVALSRVAGEALSAALILLLVRAAGDLGHVPLTQLAGDALAAFLLLAALQRGAAALPATYEAAAARPVLRESWMLVASAMLALLIFNADLVLLRVFRDSTVVGWYAAAYTLVSFLSNLGVSFGYSVLPALSRLDADAAGERGMYQTSLAAAAAATLPLAAGGAMLAPALIALVYGAGFAPAGPVLGLLLWSVPAAWLRTVAQMALVARGRQADVLRVTAVGAALTIVLDLAVIPRFGMHGAAVVTLVSEGVRAALTLVFAARAGLPMAGVRRFWRPVVATALMAIAVRQAPAWPVLAAVGLGAVAYAAALVALGTVRLGGGRVRIHL